MYSVDMYSRVRRACLKDGMSSREAVRYFNKDRKTVAKMLRHELPPGYCRSKPPRRPTFDDYVGVNDTDLHHRFMDSLISTDKVLISVEIAKSAGKLWQTGCVFIINSSNEF